MNTRGRLQEVERQHGHLSVLAVGSGEEAFAAVEDLVVGGVPVLHDLQAAVDLPAELLVCEGRAAPISRSPVQQANPGAERASWCRESNGWRHDHRAAPAQSEVPRRASGQRPGSVNGRGSRPGDHAKTNS
jgi:hypothetical protein